MDMFVRFLFGSVSVSNDSWVAAWVEEEREKGGERWDEMGG